MKQLATFLVLGSFAVAATSRADIQALTADVSAENLLEEGLAVGDPNIGGETSDPYSDLEAIYAAATAPTQDLLIGWYSGRCFLQTSKKTALNSIFMGWKEFINKDRGPLFPPEEVTKGIWGGYARQKADYFDTMTKTIESEVTAFLATEKAGLPPILTEKDAAVIRYAGVVWSMRQHLNYLVMQHREKDQVASYCYTFKKIK